MIVVVDASVAAKWYVDEERRALARDFLRGDFIRIAPHLVLLEVANVLSKKVKEGVIGRQQAIWSLEELASGAVDLLDDNRYVRRAFDISVALKHHLNDCLYLAVAEIEGVELVTDDKVFVRKCVEAGFVNSISLLQETAHLTDAGYSGTPLPRKLGLKDGQAAAFVGLPETLDDLAAAAAFASVERRDAWTGFDGPARLDLIHAFTTKRADLEAGLPGMMAALKPAGMIWVSWPKKAAKVGTDVTEDVVRAVALPLGLVDVKVCAVDATWAGLKLVIRKENR